MENGEGDAPTPSPGLHILNVAGGDFKITFDKDSPPGEQELAKQAIKDMLQRGYTIAVAIGEGQYKPIKRFDAKTNEYIVKDVPKESARTKERRLPAHKTSAIAVGPSAPGCAREEW